MTTPYTGNVVPADDTIIIPPANAYVNDAGQIVMDMSGEPGGPVAATTLSASGAVTFASTLAVAGASALHAVSATGAISASTTVAAGTTVTGGTGVIATAGGVTASAGNIVATLGNITASAGNISATLGSVTAGTTVTAGTGLTVTTGTVNLSGATLTMPTGTRYYQQYTSQVITQADLTAGASCTVALTGEPTSDVPLAAYMVTALATTSSAGTTTGLTCQLGIAGLPASYIADTSIFGAAGLKEAYTGTLITTARAADALVATFTATGGTPDCAEINQLSITFVVLYASIP